MDLRWICMSAAACLLSACAGGSMIDSWPDVHAGRDFVDNFCPARTCEPSPSDFGPPYSVEPEPKIRIALSTVHLTSPFGTRPEPVTVPVILPTGTTRWEVNPAGRIDTPVIWAEKAPDGSDAVTISVVRLTYPEERHDVPIVVEAVMPSGRVITQVINADFIAHAEGIVPTAAVASGIR